MSDALSHSAEELERINKKALERDREIARAIAAGGPEGLLKFCETIEADISGFEREVFDGRKDAMDIRRDELVAMRAYAIRVIARAKYYAGTADNGTTSQEAPKR